jgi:hypothetical protein
MSRLLLVALLALLALTSAVAPAGAMIALPAAPPPVPGNPADRLAAVPIEAFRYDPATHCAAKARRGTSELIAWLQANARGAFWGSYRCEKWGPGSASLHAENRAVDWHLDVTDRAARREARRLTLLLVAPDRLGNPQALARRMGVEEIIWDCGYWAQGMAAFSPYRVCSDKRGRLKQRLDPTVAHRDHVHFGLTRAGAAGRTSFWSGR